MINIASPLSGWVIPLEEVPDPVFSERLLGDGVAVDPVEGKLLAPAAGLIEMVHEAGHAVTFLMDEGPQLILHIGLDTVALAGAGFRPVVEQGQRVNKGDTLILFDLDVLARRARSLVTPIIITNGSFFEVTSVKAAGPVKAGEELLTLNRADTAAAALGDAEPSVSRSLILQLAHGLHARPAARLAKAVAPFEAKVDIVSSDGRAAPVRSPVGVLGLALRHGEAIAIRASGPDAKAAVGAVSDLLESGMGELLPLSKSEPILRSAVEPPELRSELRGVAAVPGIAIGPAWRLRSSEFHVAQDASDPRAEREALAAAQEQVRAALHYEAQVEGAGAAIAEAHLAMISDPIVDETAQRFISSGRSAAFAWREAIAQFAAPLRSANDPRFAERLDDLIDLERRVLHELSGEVVEVRPPSGAIVLADTLYPSQLQALAQAGIAGIATQAGGSTSHAAIIAAGLGLPMLVGLGPELALVADGADLILRGDTLVISPDPHLLGEARSQARDRSERLAAAQALVHELAATADGTRIEVFANLGSVAEASAAVAHGAEGCGLLRTEFLFLDRDAPPGEDEQCEAYQAIADALGNRPLIVRTLDIGADKPAPLLPLDAEDNPALGLRGIRLQLLRTDLLETQLRALLGVRTSAALRIMLPMVSSASEIRKTKAILDRLAGDAQMLAPELGIMVETPAAALMAGTLASESAFFSIGSNDLSQYALARDRTNPAVAKGLDGLDPAVLRLIDETARGAEAHRRMTGVCGGLAAVPEAIPILIGLGVTELSVPTGAIAEVKAVVRSLNLSRCREIAKQALAAPDGETVRAMVAPILEQKA